MKTDVIPPSLDPESPGFPGVDRFAHFEVYRVQGALDCLGFGSMGVTYRAHDSQLDRDVALKVINKEHIHDPHLRERFFREARAAARLQHPNIASVLYYGEEARVCFYVMELVRGENLDTYINRVGPLAPRHALAIAHQVLLALDAAYQAKLLHRDLKPGNIMVANYHDNRAPYAKVIDFGLAKFVAEAPGPQLTKYGLFGTPGFTSPEQWKGLPIDHRSDLYSLGATLWFLLTGRAPFTEDQALTMRKSKVFAEPALDGLDAFPLDLQHLLLRLLASSPDERPSTPMETANEIQDILRRIEETALPAPVSAAEEPAPPKPPRRTSMASRMVSALVCISIVGAVLALLLQSRSPSEAVETEAGKSEIFRQPWHGVRAGTGSSRIGLHLGNPQARLRRFYPGGRRSGSSWTPLDLCEMGSAAVSADAGSSRRIHQQRGCGTFLPVAHAKRTGCRSDQGPAIVSPAHPSGVC